MNDMASQPRERVNQKKRTRQALVEAARRLLEEGVTPTVADVADEALVSRATAYRYFPSQEHLLLEVVLERSIDEIDRSVQAAASSGDAAARLEGLVSAIHDEVSANEAGFRSLLQLSVAQPPSDEPTVARIRGERRRHWIEQALAPIAGELDAESQRRLTSAIALCVGAEALVVMRDLCGLTTQEAKETLLWAAQGLLARALSEAHGCTPAGKRA
jgi:AcrR family transcriptional regulator